MQRYIVHGIRYTGTHLWTAKCFSRIFFRMHILKGLGNLFLARAKTFLSLFFFIQFSLCMCHLFENCNEMSHRRFLTGTEFKKKNEIRENRRSRNGLHQLMAEWNKKKNILSIKTNGFHFKINDRNVILSRCEFTDRQFVFMFSTKDPKRINTCLQLLFELQNVKKGVHRFYEIRTNTCCLLNNDPLLFFIFSFVFFFNFFSCIFFW